MWFEVPQLAELLLSGVDQNLPLRTLLYTVFISGGPLIWISSWYETWARPIPTESFMLHHVISPWLHGVQNPLVGYCRVPALQCHKLLKIRKKHQFLSGGMRCQYFVLSLEFAQVDSLPSFLLAGKVGY